MGEDRESQDDVELLVAEGQIFRQILRARELAPYPVPLAELQGGVPGVAAVNAIGEG